MAFFFVLLEIYRRRPTKWIDRAAALPGGHIPQRHHRHCLCDALQIDIPVGRLQTSEIGPTDNLAESEFHGSTAGVGAESTGHRQIGPIAGSLNSQQFRFGNGKRG